MDEPARLRGVIISDTHVGGLFALADLDDPAVPRGGQGKATREALFEIYRDAATKGPYSEPDILVLNGDGIEGQNRKSNGIGTWTTDLNVQIDNATRILKMWNAKRIFVVRGSNYHVGAGNSGLQCEEQLARNVNAEPIPHQDGIPYENMERSAWEQYIHLGNITAHFAHKIAVSKVFHYQTTPTARQMLQAKLNDRLRHEIDEYRTKVVVRSHAHYFNHIEFSGSKGYVTPCWKALDDFMLSNGPLDISPDIGYLGFTVTENGGFQHEKFLWPITNIQPAPFTIVPFPVRGASGRCACVDGCDGAGNDGQGKNPKRACRTAGRSKVNHIGLSHQGNRGGKGKPKARKATRRGR